MARIGEASALIVLTVCMLMLLHMHLLAETQLHERQSPFILIADSRCCSLSAARTRTHQHLCANHKTVIQPVSREQFLLVNHIQSCMNVAGMTSVVRMSFRTFSSNTEHKEEEGKEEKKLSVRSLGQLTLP